MLDFAIGRPPADTYAPEMSQNYAGGGIRASRAIVATVFAFARHAALQYPCDRKLGDDLIWLNAN